MIPLLKAGTADTATISTTNRHPAQQRLGDIGLAAFVRSACAARPRNACLRCAAVGEERARPDRSLALHFDGVLTGQDFVGLMLARVFLSMES